MVPSEEGTALDLAGAFAALVDVIREWRAAGRITTTAGVKPALQQATSGSFNEQELGFDSYRDFVQAGAAAGHFQLQQLPNRHWLLLLPGETLAEVLGSKHVSTPPPPSSDQASTENVRLKPDVWSAFVDWRVAHSRLWDRQVGRPIVYPVDDEGRPAWEVDPARFAEIEPANEVVQIGWMREWAKSLAVPAREAITAALSDDAPRGEFRRQLNALGLVPAWRAELQRRLVQRVSDWASRHDVQLSELVDHRVRPRPPESIPITPGQPSRAQPSQSPDIARLRAMLHLVIDTMPLAELAALEIPAQYLLLKG